MSFLNGGHRFIALITSILILATVFFTWKSSRHRESLRGASRTLLGLLLLQILLGATTVLMELSVAVSTIHLVTAALVFGGLIMVAVRVSWEDQVIQGKSKSVRVLALLGLVGILIQLTIGAVVRHSHAGLACPFFPHCFNSFWPVPFSFQTSIAFLHRWWGMALVGLFIPLGLLASKRTPKLAPLAFGLLFLTALQIILGIATIMTRLETVTRAAHAALGYGLWGILFYLTIRSGNLRWMWESRSRDSQA